MTNATNAIITELNVVFAEMDAEVSANSVKWGIERAAAVTAFVHSEEYKTMKKNVWVLYPHMHAIAGGKTWYNIFQGRNDEMIAEFMVKNSKATADKRNASIAKKLIAANVTEVISSEYTRTKDGFNGCFVVNTDSGKKTITIDSIYAGGYNIQCFHVRVLVKVK